MTRPALALIVALGTASCSPGPAMPDADARTYAASADAGLAAITPAELKAHIDFLADDLLEGRSPGTRGYDIAARYVAAQFETMGLEPAGDAGGFLQRVPLLETTASPSTVVELRVPGASPLRLTQELFLAAGDPRRPSVHLSAPLVFVGFGVEAPEYGHDDYASVDVRGKVVVALFGAPKGFTSTTRAYYGVGPAKRRAAARHGAVGLVHLATPQSLKGYPWELLAADARSRVTWTEPNGSASDDSDALQLTGWLRDTVAARLFAGSRLRPDEVFDRAARGEPVPAADLAVTLTADVVSEHRPYESANVAAIYRGGDLRDEFVVYSAHLDHLGIGRAVDGDAIYNGVFDNASGVAGMLAVARAFTRLADKPRRSVLFVAVTAEEARLVGSDYFAQHPPVPVDAIAANVNIDILPLLYDFSDVVALGTEHSSLIKPVQMAAARLGLTVVPDYMPDEGFFVRSDQYSFVEQGIPAVYTYEGRRAVEPGVDAQARMSEWIATRYHRPSDDLRQPLNFVAAVKGARLQFLIGHAIASDAQRPRWNDGDFFGRLFGSAQQGRHP